MRWGKKISHLLLMIVLCILIFYVGIYLQIDVSGNALSFNFNQELLDSAGRIYLAGLFYSDEVSENGRETIHHAIARKAFNLMPIGNYVNAKENIEFQVEDDETYEMILAMQADDENI